MMEKYSKPMVTVDQGLAEGIVVQLSRQKSKLFIMN